MRELSIGVLALQGAIEEHIAMTKLALKEMELKGDVHLVKRPEEVQEVDGLIIPGGESTVMGKLSKINQAFQATKTEDIRWHASFRNMCMSHFALKKSLR